MLTSGGLDSTTCLELALRAFKGRVVGLSIDYGQRHKTEIDHAKRYCQMREVPHYTLGYHVIPPSMLTSERIEVPDIAYEDIEGVSPMYVPFRNGQFLSAASAHAVFHNCSAPLLRCTL